jgi:K+-dependent Na+/Ca+ exchanger-like protein
MVIGMRLYRRNAAPKWLRRRAAFWTSVGTAAILSVGISVFLAAGGATAFGDYAGPRFLKGASSSSGDDGSAYPDDPFIDKPYNEASNKHLIIIHIVVIAYMLLGLNTVCDLYFTGALDEMVNKWDIKPDVAGATFMAAGGSAPELFTSLIGAVISESDVGFGTIVGSAVFNVLFVIGLCGFAAEVPIKLTWWPLARDCTYYIFGLCVLALFAKTDKNISLWEAMILFCGYLGYCTLMYYNDKLEERFVQKSSDPVTELKPVSVIPVAADTGSTAVAETEATHDHQEQQHHHHHIKKSQPHFERKHEHTRASTEMQRRSSKDAQADTDQSTDESAGPEPPEEGKPPILPVDDQATSEEEDDIEELLEKPEGTIPQVIWCVCLPIYVLLYYGIPKPNERWFMATFAVSLLWIAGFSFFLVYCVEILGDVLGIHIIIMGFTLLAAGTSIPDLVSSMAVARAGEGDMAVSSSIGSNIFDILVGLPIPWIIKILFVEIMGNGNTSYAVPIISDYIVMYVIILVVMVLCVVVSIHLQGWYLNKMLGVGMAMLYAIFLIIVLSVEFSEPEALKF